MAIRVKTEKEIIVDIQKSIRTETGDGIAIYENSSAFDLFINPLKDIILDTDVVADFISRSRSLNELERVIRDANYQDRLRFALNYTFPEVQRFISITLDNLVSNWNEVRKSAQKSKGILRLYFLNNSNLNISIGLIFETTEGIQFTNTNSFSSFIPFYDSIEGLYYVETSIESLLSGQSGNVEAGTIVNIVSTVTGLQKVVNIERTQFGREIETDLQLIDRVRTSWKSRNTTVLSGFVKKIYSYPGIIDLSVVMYNNDELKRNEKNAVDIYILSETKSQLKEDIFNTVSARYAWERLDNEIDYEIYPTNYNSLEQSSFKLLSQPVISLNALSYASSPLGSYTTISDTQYELNKDSTGVYAQSIRGHDFVIVNNSSLPNNSWLKVSYTYDRLFKDLQSLFLNYDTSIIGADILFKRAKELSVDIEVIPKIYSGFNATQVKEKITSDLNIFFAGGFDSNSVERLQFKLNQKVDKSDVANIIIDVSEVDSIDLETFKIKINGVDINQSYTPKINEYLVLGTVTYSVSQGGNITPINSTTLNLNNE